MNVLDSVVTTNKRPVNGLQAACLCVWGNNAA